MVKRIALLGLGVFVIASILFAIHLFYQPEPAPLVLLNYGRTLSFEYHDVKPYVLKKEGHAYLFFCDGGVDCQYVNDNMLAPLAKQIKAADFNDLTFVDMSKVAETMSPAKLFDDWGISKYPAFVAVHVEEGQKTIENTLQWDFAAPFSKEDIKQWMIDNDIWKGPID
ncbi:MAG: hypothetical protein GX845_00025 [Erysipelothrix sp.]|nr:hypothetical protein [Erysipelothrix sp.]